MSIAGNVLAAFEENLASRGEVGASVSVWHKGKEIVSRAGGFRDRAKTEPWNESTLVLCWSATKGPSAACLLHVMQEHGIALDRKIGTVWPEFAVAGKQDATFGHLLTHSGGVPGLAKLQVSALDHAAVAAALAAAEPHWPPGSAHGYHPRTTGYLWDELVRRLTGGTTIGEYWRKVFADPMALEFWIGLPESELPRVAEMLPSRTPQPPPEAARLYEEITKPGSLSRMAFRTPGDLQSIASMNTRTSRMASLPAISGIGTASALAQFYSMLAAGGVWDGRTYFREEFAAGMQRPLVSGPDRILLVDTAFSTGFMMDPVNAAGAKVRNMFGPSQAAFGHPGAGGSQAFADPENGIGFAYLMNQMALGAFPNERARALTEALYEAFEI